jgi:hypothetical protein
MLADACNLSTEEAEAGGSTFKARPGYIASLRPAWSYIVRPCLKKQNKKQAERKKKKESMVGESTYKTKVLCSDAGSCLGIFFSYIQGGR